MDTPSLGSVAHHLCLWIDAKALADVPDRPLLDRFIGHRDEAAFAALVRRHGPMVLHVCRRVLGRLHDAEDVFQATFLLLARKASAIRKREALSSFLHGVAYRLAVRAKEQARRRQGHEQRSAEARSSEPSLDAAWQEVQGVLDEELQRLPAKHRTVLVLCYLESLTQEKAARRLGCPVGTVRSRLARARRLLHQRLVRRGLTLSAATMATALLARTAPAALPSAFLRPLMKAALPFAAGQAIEGISQQAVLLAAAGLKAMSTAKLKTVLTVALVLTTLSVGVGGLTYFVLADQFTPSRQAEAKRPDKPKLAEEAKNPPAPPKDALPAGAIRRLGSLRLRHHHELSLSTAFSPDGKRLATCSLRRIRLWDRENGALLREMDGSFGLGLPIFSADGRMLAAGGSVLDSATGRLLHRFDAERVPCAFSADGKHLATSRLEQSGSQGDLCSIRLWDTATWKCVAALPNQLGFDHLATFCSQDRTLVTACQHSGTICHWDVPAGKLRKTIRLSLPRARQACLSSDGRLLAVAPYNNRDAAAVWDTDTGRQRCVLEGEDAGTDLALALSPDNKLLATALLHGSDPATISLWDAGTGKRLRRISAPPGAGYFLQFAPDNRTLLSSGLGPRVRLWDTATGKQLLADSGHAGEIYWLSFTPNGRTLLSADGNGMLQTWDTASGQPRRRLDVEGWGSRAVALAADGKSVLSGGRDGWIRLHDLDTGKQRRRFGIDRRHQILSLRLSPDGRTAVSWSVTVDSPNAVFHVWDVATGNVLARRADPILDGGRLFSSDAKLVLTRVDTPAAKPADDEDMGLRPPIGIFRPSSLLLQEVASGRVVLRLPLPDSFGLVQAFAPDGRTLVTATGKMRGFEGTPSGKHALHIWDVATGKEQRTIAPPQSGSAYRFEQLAIAPDSRTLATVRADRTLQLWDLATGAELLRRNGFSSSVNCLAFLPDSRMLATGHADSTILLWDVAVERRPPRRP